MIEPNPYSERDIKDLIQDLKIRIDKINNSIRDINCIYNSLDCAINWENKCKEARLRVIINGQNGFSRIDWNDNKTTSTEHLWSMRDFFRNNPEMFNRLYEQSPTTEKETK